MAKKNYSEELDLISETPEYSPKSEFSKARVCEQAVVKCIEARGKEMRKGYWNMKLNPKTGEVIKTWIPDSRKEFIGCVEALKSLLSPEIRRNPAIKKSIRKLLKKKKVAFKLYCYEERELEWKKTEDEQTIPFWVKTGRNFLPEIDEVVVVPSKNNPQSINPSKTNWNNYINAYYDEVFEIYDKIFARLNILVDQLNYFKQQISF
jgi:hypothetical protein